MYNQVNDDLYSYAMDNNYAVLQFPTQKFESISMIDETNNCFIGMSSSAIETSKEERVHLAHELGHCATGSFYNAYAPLFLRGQAECQADRWAIKKIIPKSDFLALLRSGMSAYELSDYFNVTEQYIHKAFHLYVEIE